MFKLIKYFYINIIILTITFLLSVFSLKLYIIICLLMLIFFNICFLFEFKKYIKIKNSKGFSSLNLTKDSFLNFIVQKTKEIYNIEDFNFYVYYREDKIFEYFSKEYPFKRRIRSFFDEDIYIIIETQKEKNISEDLFFDVFNFINIYIIMNNYKDDFNKVKKEIKLSQIQFLSKLRLLADRVDNPSHNKRIGLMSKKLARLLGINEKYVFEISVFAPLHDIGKIFIPESILKKPFHLNKEEFNIIKKHSIYGAEILQGIDWLKVAWEISLYHHEKFSGGGYPFGLKKDSIPISARIVSIIDVYDSIRSEKVYKASSDHIKTIEKMILMQKNNDYFDPDIFSIFIENNELFNKIFEEN
ncbi:HD domain-containing protein [Oceanotoga teriensis]|uniref:HD domain-containing protein n=1 Tax=Oceanotoga teriensis TaxID=515440 RepID=A0AA45C609_9BACT|nr:HD domain-containing protein [Oceanotoga teriensis]